MKRKEKAERREDPKTISPSLIRTAKKIPRDRTQSEMESGTLKDSKIRPYTKRLSIDREYSVM